jgi:hypothetical protein
MATTGHVYRDTWHSGQRCHCCNLTDADIAGRQVSCTKCGTGTDPLAVFPGGVCLACWAQSPEGRRMPTAGELTAMWGGPAKRSRRR